MTKHRLLHCLLTVCATLLLVLACRNTAEPETSSPTAAPSVPYWSEILYKKAAFVQGWKFIVIHHSATNTGNAKSFDEYHRSRGFGGLAYHFVIGNGHGSKDGEIEVGFRWKDQMAGTHVTVNSWYHNIFGIGICLVGDFTTHKPTEKQMAALTGLVAYLMKQYDIPIENVIGHKDVNFGTISWNDQALSVKPIPGKFEKDSCPGAAFPWERLRVALKGL